MCINRPALLLGLMASFVFAKTAKAMPEGWPASGCQSYCEQTYQPGSCEEYAIKSCEAVMARGLAQGNFVVGQNCMTKANDKCVKGKWSTAQMCNSLCSGK